MRDLALNPTTGDLMVTAGELTLTGAPNATTVDAVEQKLRIRLSLLLGEYLLDTSVGIPYTQTILGVKGNQAIAEGIFRQAITTCPGVASLLSFSLTVGANRQASLSFSVKAITGDVVTINDFQPGGF